MKNRIKLNISNLKSSIAQKKIRKTDLAIEIGVTRETFSRWLGGKVEYIDEGKLVKLSEILGCEMSWLSPEIAPKIKAPSLAWNSSNQIRGDDFIRLGLFSGLCRELSTLYAHTQVPEIVEDGKVNHDLMQALQSLFDLNFSGTDTWYRQPQDQHKNHEVFEIIARFNLIDGIFLLHSQRIEESIRMFKRVIIQARSEWIISLAYLISGFCSCLKSSPKEAIEEWSRGLATFPSSNDDLTLFVQGNLHLALSLYSIELDVIQASENLIKARQKFTSIGYRYGHARCLSYEALVLALQNKREESQLKAQEVATSIHHLPRLYQLEAFLLGARIHLRYDQQEAALQSIEMAHIVSQGQELFAGLVRNQLMKIVPSNDGIKEQARQIKLRWPAMAQDLNSRKAL